LSETEDFQPDSPSVPFLLEFNSEVVVPDIVASVVRSLNSDIILSQIKTVTLTAAL